MPCALAETKDGVAQACPAPGPSCPSDSSGGPDAESPLSRACRLAHGRLPPSLRRSFLQGLARLAAQLESTRAVREAFAGFGTAPKSLAALSQVYVGLEFTTLRRCELGEGKRQLLCQQFDVPLLIDVCTLLNNDSGATSGQGGRRCCHIVTWCWRAPPAQARAR